MLNKFKNLVTEEQGQGLTEYGLLLAGVVAILIVAIAAFNTTLTAFLGRVTAQIAKLLT